MKNIFLIALLTSVLIGCKSEDDSMVAQTAPIVVPQFLQNLSELNLFQGELVDLNPSIYAFQYKINTTLYTDYALKQRIIALPSGQSMTYVDNELPDFPDNTVIAKTFYYNVDDRDTSLGKTIIETRVLIKQNGNWEFGDYLWNEDQTEATLITNGSSVAVNWIDSEGNVNDISYKVPSNQDCITCHSNSGVQQPIGPKLRSMNFNVAGVNQLQKFMNEGYLMNAPNPTSITVLPNWEDTTLSDEVRVRAYFDMNCAHCHSPGGFHTENYFNALDVRYETSFTDSRIYEERESIFIRIQTSIDEYSMPFLGVTNPHAEALELILPYLESL